MQDEGKFGNLRGTPEGEFSCADFDLLLSDAIDGKLSEANQAGFERHVAACPTCGPIFADTQAGLQWLKVLELVEAPGRLIHNILAATSVQDEVFKAETEQRTSWRARFARSFESMLAPLYHAMRQPRFALNTAMAFFSVSLLLNVAGIRLSNVHVADLSPGAIKKSATLKYDETTSRIVKYYENIRFVYELESTVRELKRATTNNNEEQRPAPKKKEDNTSQQPEKQKENYNRLDSDVVLAGCGDSDELSHQTIASFEEQSLLREGGFQIMQEVSIQSPRRRA